MYECYTYGSDVSSISTSLHHGLYTRVVPIRGAPISNYFIFQTGNISS